MHNKKFIAMMMAFVLSATPVFAAAQENEGLNKTEPIEDEKPINIVPVFEKEEVEDLTEITAKPEYFSKSAS